MMTSQPATRGARGDTTVEAVAAEVIEVLGTGRQVAPFCERNPGFGLVDAYRVAAAVRDSRQARGERPIGRKIGFTNRKVWAAYAPMWGYVYDTTVSNLAEAGSEFPLTRLAEPRIEPEIVFRLSAAPAAGMDDAALLGCIEWVAHGFEIVQSIYPGWAFTAADAVAAGGLLIGPRHPIAPNAADWRRDLAHFSIDLFRDGDLAGQGHAANVFDGPVSALRHLADLLDADRISPPLAPGEIVTTGTLTAALPVAAGETWSTALVGVSLESGRLRFA